MNLFFSKLLLQKRADKIIISPKMRDDEMDFSLTCVGFGILEFSRQNKRIRINIWNFIDFLAPTLPY